MQARLQGGGDFGVGGFLGFVELFDLFSEVLAVVVEVVVGHGFALICRWAGI